jgi:creatinine amidohydrolase
MPHRYPVSTTRFAVTLAGFTLAGPLVCPARAQPASAASSAGTVTAAPAPPTPLPVQWEELTGPDFPLAVAQAGGTAVIPLGIVERHGPHLPLGTDLINIRAIALRAAAEEYAIVFPPYFVGQIFEARHQPGTLAYSERLMWDLLQETVDELARNGITKIVLVNGHGGNNNFLPFFCQAQLARRRTVAVFLYQPAQDPEQDPAIQSMLKTPMDWHGGEVETSTMMGHRPDLVRLERAGDGSGADQARLEGLTDVYTGIWWYARFPNHYAGDAAPSSAALGEKVIAARARHLAGVIRQIKADRRVLELQDRFFDEAEAPLKPRP